MAALPLAANQSASLDELLASLEANVLPNPPSSWPWPPGYWVIIFLVAILALLALWQWHRTKINRLVKKHIKVLQDLPTIEERSIGIHQLIRWTAQQRAPHTRAMPSETFKHWLTESAHHPVPAWFNSHYYAKPDPIDWVQAEKLLMSILDGAKR